MGVLVDKQRRELMLTKWTAEKLKQMNLLLAPDFRLTPASDDASFRRYFRAVTTGGQTFICVDAPPQLEDSAPFVQVSGLLIGAGLVAPDVLHADLEQGFMLLTDLGDRLYLDIIRSGDEEQVRHVYGFAIDAILKMQRIHAGILPVYDQALLEREMRLFPDWFLSQQLALVLSDDERAQIDGIFTLLIDSALSQPRVFVHRDFHSRNLMVIAGDAGIIDFQDAVNGPVTYDLVSLLRDCYHRFDTGVLDHWLNIYLSQLQAGTGIDVDERQFRRWFDLMGMQRHLKCAGIFSRLNLRDGKPRYLADIPLVMSYIREVCAGYEELAEFGRWLDSRVMPRLDRLGPA